MPKDGKNRRSGRDEARGNDLAGALGGDEDYDWIKYLGEGRSPSSSATPAQPPPASPAQPPPASPAQTVVRPAARPEPLPQRVRGGGPDREAGRRRGPEPAGSEEQHTGYGARQSRQGDARPGSRPVTGRAVKVRPGRTTDLLFNPQAEDYSQPLYPATDDGQRRAIPPEQDWQRDWEPEARPAPRRGELLPPRRLDTAEYAQPLYPGVGAAPATGARPQRSWPDDDPLADTGPRRPRSRPDDDPLADTDAGGQPVRRGRRTASRGGPRPAVRSGSSPVLPDRVDRTGPQRRVSGLSPTASSQRTIADPLDEPVGDVAAPQIMPQIQPPVRGRPARKPRKSGRPKSGQGRPRAGKGRPAVGQARSGTRRRVPVKVMVVLGSAIIATLAVVGYVVLRPQASHVVSAPASQSGYARQPANATANDLRHKIVAAAGGAVRNVVAAVYQRTTGPGTKKGPQIVVFIGGNLSGGASADNLISAYMTRLPGAFTTTAGRLGGRAACAPGSNGGPAECAWADNDTFGVVVSATLNSAGLADVMRQMRPQVEHVVR